MLREEITHSRKVRLTRSSLILCYAMVPVSRHNSRFIQ
jgi:hypothetical protein